MHGQVGARRVQEGVVRVAQRTVPEVVAQAGELEHERVEWQALVALRERPRKALRQVADPDAVLESRVRGARKHVVHRRELLDSLQPLKLGSVDDRDQAVFPVRVPVDGAKDGLHFFSCKTQKSTMWRSELLA